LLISILYDNEYFLMPVKQLNAGAGPSLRSQVRLCEWTAASCLFLICLGSPNLFGLGFRNPNQDAEAIARGNAFVATADNPSAIYYNPAGIVQLEGHNVRIGAHVLTVESTYRSPLGGEFESETGTQAVPQLYYVHAPKGEPYAWGLGIYAPFGGALEWPDSSGFSTLGQEGELVYATINPVLAWSLTESLDIAFGPTINRGDLNLKQAVPLVPGGQFVFDGNDTQLGFTLGTMWRPFEKWSVGLSYHSATTMEFDGYTELRGIAPRESAVGTVEFPDFIKAGISYRPNPRWNLEVGLDWTDRDGLDAVVIEQSISGTVMFPLNWKSSFMVHAGASRYFDNGYWLAAGYFFSENSVTELNFNPLVPDTDLHVGSVGVGSRVGRWQWALSGQLITGASRDVTGSLPSAFGQSANGSYQWFNFGVNFAVQSTF
jgi:long-chain fatty acid transport protein